VTEKEPDHGQVPGESRAKRGEPKGIHQQLTEGGAFLPALPPIPSTVRARA